MNLLSHFGCITSGGHRAEIAGCPMRNPLFCLWESCKVTAQDFPSTFGGCKSELKGIFQGKQKKDILSLTCQVYQVALKGRLHFMSGGLRNSAPSQDSGAGHRLESYQPRLISVVFAISSHESEQTDSISCKGVGCLNVALNWALWDLISMFLHCKAHRYGREWCKLRLVW